MKIYLLDIDQTILNTELLYNACLVDNNLCLDKYRKAQKNEQLMLSAKPLPLLAWYHKNKHKYNIMFLTARELGELDKKQLALFGIPLNKVFSRDRAKQSGYNFHNANDGIYKLEYIKRLKGLYAYGNAEFVMVDDSRHVKKELRKNGITCYCAIKLNNKMVQYA
jgi:hypothetical protein